MEVKFALLADVVTQTREGKLILIGEFDRVWSRTPPPVTFGPFCLVARFEASISEGSAHQLTARLLDDDGNVVVPQLFNAQMPFKATGRGRPLRAQVVIQIQAIRFEKFAVYEFHLLLDGHLTTTVPLAIAPVPMQPDPPQDAVG